MIRKDYILRLVDEFGKFLAKIARLRLEGDYDDALKLIDDIYQGMLNAEPKVLKSIDTDKLVEYLQQEKKFSNQYLKMIAELLFEEGHIYIENGDPISARNVLEKSKVLIEYLMENDATFSFDWYDKLTAIDNALAI